VKLVSRDIYDACKLASCSILRSWHQSIINTMWWSFANCKGTKQIILFVWTFLPNCNGLLFYFREHSDTQGDDPKYSSAHAKHPCFPGAHQLQGILISFHLTYFLSTFFSIHSNASIWAFRIRDVTRSG
jgi:hypothetical protein